VKGQARLIRLPPLKRNGFTMRFGGNITSVIGKPFGAAKNRAQKRHSSLEWTMAVARHRMRKFTQEVRGETYGRKPGKKPLRAGWRMCCQASGSPR
jgi:hypothetical protein